MTDKILVVVEDLIFLSKILHAARRLGVKVENVDPSQLEKSLKDDGARAVILDLNHRSGAALEILKFLKSDPALRDIPVVAFLSHVQTDLARAAREAGCDLLLARSAFAQKLPSLLRDLAEARPPSVLPL